VSSSYTGGPGSRREARERALTLLYEAETKSRPPSEVVAALPLPPEDFTVELLAGVEEHRDEADAHIERLAKGWTVDRMPALDRALLRMGAFELAHRPDIPVAVTINEAVELAKRFSTDDSGRFVNGVLSKLADELGRTAPPDPAG
jgi:transcription antitermination protein NusB